MNRVKFRDYSIRPKGSPEVPYDPLILSHMILSRAQQQRDASVRRERVTKVHGFILKIALEILPKKQREIFYSVWVRSGGKLNLGIMEFSRRIKRSHFTAYNNYYKSLNSLKNYLERSGYMEHIIDYLKGRDDKLIRDDDVS